MNIASRAISRLDIRLFYETRMVTADKKVPFVCVGASNLGGSHLFFRRDMNESEFREMVEVCQSDVELFNAEIERLADHFPDPGDFSVTLTLIGGEEFEFADIDRFRLWHASRQTGVDLS